MENKQKALEMAAAIRHCWPWPMKQKGVSNNAAD